MCDCGTLVWETKEVAGEDGNPRARVRTDEDRSSVRAWRFTRCFSAWDAEAVEVVGSELQVLLHGVGWLVGSDAIAISLTDQQLSTTAIRLFR